MQPELQAFGIPFLVMEISFFISMRRTGGDDLRPVLGAADLKFSKYLLARLYAKKKTCKPAKSPDPKIR